MITLPQLKALAKQNKISCTYLNKDEIIALLKDKNIITTLDDIIDSKIEADNDEPIKRNADKSNYEHLKGIRNNPKTVEIFDRQTDETSIFSSSYKVRRALKISPPCIKDGAVWKKRYEIKVT